jgi:hypothetical protein
MLRPPDVEYALRRHALLWYVIKKTHFQIPSTTPGFTIFSSFDEIAAGPFLRESRARRAALDAAEAPDGD